MRPVSVFILFFTIQDIQASPLFEEGSGEPLVVSIETDLSKIRNEKKQYHSATDNYLNGRFELQDRAFAVRIQTRGHNRLSRCTFPPLRVYFDKAEIKNTLFKLNHSLKLVTHCEEDELELLFREYLVYRLYNLITPYSFQVRLLKIEYVDINRQVESIDSYAFFIESPNSIEKRLNLDELESDQDFNMKTYESISKNWLNISQTKLQDAFQHFIRNNDWVIFYADPPGILSAANIKFFYNEKQGFPFPYDFDLAGLVTWDIENYHYRYGIANLCENAEMKKAIARISSHKDGYFQLLEQDSLLSAKYKKDFARYLDEFGPVDVSCSRVGLY